MRLAAFVALALAATPSLVHAAPTPPDDMAEFDKELNDLFGHGGLTAEQAAQRAGKTSPSVRRKAAEVAAAIAQAEQAELARVPIVQAKASYTRLSHIDPVVIPFGAMNFTIASLENSYDVQTSAVVPLSDYVFRYPKLIDAAKQAEVVAKMSERGAYVDAGEDARLAYYEWVRAQLQVLIAKRQLAQVQVTLEQVKALAEAQRIGKAELLRVESQEAEAEQAVDQLKNLSVLREEQLRILIGAADSEQLTIGEDIRGEITAAPEGKLDDLVQHATTHRLDVSTLDAGIHAKELQTESEKANTYPHFSAFGTVDDARPNQRVFPQVDEFRLTWSAGVQLTWTLGDTLTSKTNVKRLRAETSELVADRENLIRGARVQVLAAQQAVSLAQHALSTTKKGLDAAEEGYRVRRELLAAERATAVELVDSQTDLTRARIAALNARVDLRVAVTQLSHALGDDASAAK